MKSLTYIYGLVDPRDGQVRYIGKTVKEPKYRLATHICESISKERSNWHKSRWIAQLLGLGLRPEIRILETVPSDGDWVEAEQRWIREGRLQGWPLTNLTDGGEGAAGYKLCPITCLLRSAAQRGKPKPPEFGDKVRAALKGRSPSQACQAASIQARYVAFPDEAIALLGVETDAEVGRRFGIKSATVTKRRRDLGIPKLDPYTPEVIALMGTVSDKEIARLIGRNSESVREKRIRLGIPAFSPARDTPPHGAPGGDLICGHP